MWHSDSEGAKKLDINRRTGTPAREPVKNLSSTHGHECPCYGVAKPLGLGFASLRRALVAMGILVVMSGAAVGQEAGAGRVVPNRGDVEINGRGEPPRPPRPRVANDRVVPAGAEAPNLLIPPAPPNLEQMTSPQGMSSTLRLMFVLTILSLAPSILIMTTCFIRFVIVFGLLRQALGTQQLPPNQVIVSLCLFLTFFVMAPVWQKAYDAGVKPYTEEAPIEGMRNGEDRFAAATRLTLQPIRQFMADQIEQTGNSDSIWMLLEMQRPAAGTRAAEEYVEPENYEDVPLSVLLPAYMLSELKTAFVIGFQIYLPFLVIDMVVSSILTSMGMMMLPPVLISNPLKLLLFVLIDGWMLTVGMLVESVRLVGS